MARKKDKSRQSAELILSAAEKLFCEKGFRSTTIRDLAHEIQLLPGSIHYWYPSKSAILVELAKRALMRSLLSFQEAHTYSADPLTRLVFAIHHYMMRVLQGDSSLEMIIYEFPNLKGEARAQVVQLRDQIDAEWDRLLQEAAAVTPLRAGIDLKLMRNFGLGAVLWTQRWFSTQGRYQASQVAHHFINAYLQGIFILPAQIEPLRLLEQENADDPPTPQAERPSPWPTQQP